MITSNAYSEVNDWMTQEEVSYILANSGEFKSDNMREKWDTAVFSTNCSCQIV